MEYLNSGKKIKQMSAESYLMAVNKDISPASERAVDEIARAFEVRPKIHGGMVIDLNAVVV